MTKEQERAEIAFKALSELDIIIPKDASSSSIAGEARRVLQWAKSNIEKTYK